MTTQDGRARANDAADTGARLMAQADGASATLEPLDDATIALVRAAAAVSAASEELMRVALAAAVIATPPEWVEELILQTYLFAGFPRALNAMRIWRRISGRSAPTVDGPTMNTSSDQWVEQGERTCAVVYGPFYDRLRVNIAHLHPALDSWMIAEGYGKVLSRPDLDIRRRELCVVAACAASGQDRQLHSHLHGALHAGASMDEVAATLLAVADFVRPDDRARYRNLLIKVAGQ